ncbi:uncharacterized protein A4U43_C08F22290 [Asparagus officinalis]|nr:uncharacterized protein A4U43_C08F22290 [Asparagus officinalis]
MVKERVVHRVADNLPPPEATAKLLLSNLDLKALPLRRRPALLQSLVSTNISVVIGGANGDIPNSRTPHPSPLNESLPTFAPLFRPQRSLHHPAIIGVGFNLCGRRIAVQSRREGGGCVARKTVAGDKEFFLWESSTAYLSAARLKVEADEAYLSNESTVTVTPTFFEDACKSSCEGIMAKTLDIDAGYCASKRTDAWLKVKRDYIEELGDSLDLVPIGAWYGNGRKAGWYSPFLMACYNPDAKEFQSVCRVMSGFSDEFYKSVQASSLNFSSCLRSE